ncbi:MAG: hypothetical protein E7363_01295 [Clostridiales bacterium]|nr:hypothetical protein [Clostridiales bacterium]
MKWQRKYNLNIETLSLKALRTAVYTTVAVILAVVCVYITTVSAKVWYLPLFTGVGLTASFFIKVIMQDNIKRILLLFGADWALLLLLSFFLEQPMVLVLNLCILTAFYVSLAKLWIKSVGTMLCFFTYLLMTTDVFRIFNRAVLSDLISTLFVFWFVFFLVNLCVVYIEKLRDEKINVEQSREKEEQLQKAYRELENVTILRERNRIAKDIHDNVGHAITTVIMQTEAAKLSLEQDVEKAKRCILAANMQAVSALEQMRSSVHLLSENSTVFDLARELDMVIAETTTGTDITVRAQIDPEVSALPYPIALLLHRALKEGLNNGIRHGKATAFLFQIRMTDGGKAEFLLSDNGGGVKNFTQGFGLSSLTKQLQSHGYEAEFYSEGGEGFEMQIHAKRKGERE